MPKFDVAKADLECLVGKSFTVEEWEDLFLYAKCELDDVWEALSDQALQISFGNIELWHLYPSL